MGCLISVLNSVTNVICDICSYLKKLALFASSAEERNSASRTNSLYSAFALDPGSFPPLSAIDSFVPSGQYLVDGHVLCSRQRYDSFCLCGTQSPVVKHDNKE